MFYRAPVLILAFNRPDLFYATLCRLFKYSFSDVWVSVDGPRPTNPDDTLAISAIHDLCKCFQLPNSRLRFAEVNQGCRNGVIAGISWFFKHNFNGIIIEDDVEIDNNYLLRMSTLLLQNSDNPNIFSVSSHSAIAFTEPNFAPTDFVLSPMCRVWGWASWADRWQKHLNLLTRFKDASIIQIYTSIPQLYRSLNAANLISMCKNRVIDTWDYEWNFTHILYQAYSITPCSNFCLNHGFRPDATHTLVAESVPWSTISHYPIDSVSTVLSLSQFPAAMPRNINAIASICNECGFPLIANNYLQDLKFFKHLISLSFRYLRQILHREILIKLRSS